MKIRLIALFLLAALALTACGSDDIDMLTPEEAQKAVLDHTGLSAADVEDVHTHIAQNQEAPSYSIHITVGGTEYEFIIDATDGEILYSENIP